MKVDRSGRNELINAVIDRKGDVVDRLLSAGVDPNLADYDGRTALHFAVRNNDVTNCAALIVRGADVAATDRNGNSALSDAVFAFCGDGTCIELLLASGADPDQINIHGVSPRSLSNTIANLDSTRYFR